MRLISGLAASAVALALAAPAGAVATYNFTDLGTLLGGTNSGGFVTAQDPRVSAVSGGGTVAAGGL